MKLYKVIYSIIFVCLFVCGAFAQNVSLKINIEGISELRGSIFIAVYNKNEGFNAQENAVRLMTKKVDNYKTHVVISDLPKGNYAISLFHDENDNQVIDKNMLGIPTEKYGFSRDARRRFSAPTYDESVISLKSDVEITVTIK